VAKYDLHLIWLTVSGYKRFEWPSRKTVSCCVAEYLWVLV